MNVIYLEQANKPTIDSRKTPSHRMLTNDVCHQHFADQFERILAVFQDEQDFQALTDLVRFLNGLDAHIKEVNQLKQSAETLKNLLLETKIKKGAR